MIAVEIIFSTSILIVVVYFVRYGMRYVAMSLRVALAEKFPDAAESEILKVRWVLRLFDS